MSETADPRTSSIEDGLRQIRDTASRQREIIGDRAADFGPDELPRFSPHLPEVLAPDRRAELLEQAGRLEPWLQGPFVLGADLTIGGAWRNDLRWRWLEGVVGDVAGLRVLDVGSNAGYDAFEFRRRGAAEVLACEPFEFFQQAVFLESLYESGVDFRNIGWQELHPEAHGRFDLVHCHGVLYHEPHPLALLTRLREMVDEGGQLLLGSMMLAGPDVSEYVRFVPDAYAADPTWWFVPGRLALRWMLEAVGFEVEPDLGVLEGPRGEFHVVNGYLRGRPTAPAPELLDGAPTDVSPPGGRRAVMRFPIGHYYSPMYDTREVSRRRDRIWGDPDPETPGIDWREDDQVALCSEVFARQEPLSLPREASDDPTEYFAENDQYPALDAWVLAGLLRELRPRRMIEVGSGFSSLVAARVNREYLEGSMRLTCIEPFPRPFLLEGVPGIADLRTEEVQDTPLELFSELGAGDVLFIDTSHTVKTGNDVTWLFGEVLPRLRPGVHVHVHDIFLPGDYPEPWVREGWGWNEAYLVRAFLAFNAAFEIVWGSQLMVRRHRDALVAVFPEYAAYEARAGAALWLRRTDATGG